MTGSGTSYWGWTWLKNSHKSRKRPTERTKDARHAIHRRPATGRDADPHWLQEYKLNHRWDCFVPTELVKWQNLSVRMWNTGTPVYCFPEFSWYKHFKSNFALSVRIVEDLHSLWQLYFFVWTRGKFSHVGTDRRAWEHFNSGNRRKTLMSNSRMTTWCSPHNGRL